MDSAEGARAIKPTEELFKRRVSISDQVLGIDNPAFGDHNLGGHRRISGSSEHNSEGRRKSILHHPTAIVNTGGNCSSAESVAAHQHINNKLELENGRANGRKKSAFSLTSSIRDKIEYTDELER